LFRSERLIVVIVNDKPDRHDALLCARFLSYRFLELSVMRLRPRKARRNPTTTNSSAYELRVLSQTFGRLEHSVFARLYARVLDRYSCSRKSMPEKFTDRRRSAGHSVSKPEIIYGLELVGRKHNLQPLFPCKTRLSVVALHRRSQSLLSWPSTQG
jgi:hypothetical protein